MMARLYIRGTLSELESFWPSLSYDKKAPEVSASSKSLFQGDLLRLGEELFSSLYLLLDE